MELLWSFVINWKKCMMLQSLNKLSIFKSVAVNNYEKAMNMWFILNVLPGWILPLKIKCFFIDSFLFCFEVANF